MDPHDASYPTFASRLAAIFGLKGTPGPEELLRHAEELVESERRLNEGERLSGVGSWEYDLETDRLSFSREMCRFYNLPFGFVRTFEDFTGSLSPERRAAFVARVEESLRNRTPLGYDQTAPMADGRVRTTRGTGAVVLDEHGRLVRLRGVVRDITEARLAEEAIAQKTAELETANAALSWQALELETANAALSRQAVELAAQHEALRLSNQRLDEQARMLARQNATIEQQKDLLDRLMDHVPAALAYLDRQLVFRHVNPAFSRLLKLPLDQLVDHHVSAVFPWAHQELVPLLWQVLDTGRPSRRMSFSPSTSTEGAGETAHWDSTYVPVFDRHGEIEGLLVLSVEVSERIENERLQQVRIEHFRHLNEMKDNFFAVLSHELRTPLTVIQGSLNLLERYEEHARESAVAACHRRIQLAVDSLNGLVGDLVQTARLQAGRFELKTAPVRLETLLDEALEAFTPLAEEKRVRLRRELEGALPQLPGDPQRLAQVLRNLLRNAIRHTSEGGEVVLSARPVAEGVRIEVSDSGEGIALDLQERLFERFATAGVEEGLGLGLFIVRELVEAHGGRVDFESVPERGTTFAIELPSGSAIGLG